MLKFTIPANGEPRWIAAEHILMVEPPFKNNDKDQKAGAFLTLLGHDRVVAVRESAEEVARRVQAAIFTEE